MNVEQLLELHRFRHPEMFSIWASYCFYMNPNGSHPCWYWWCAGHRSDSAALGVPYSEEWTCCEMTSDPWRKDLKPSQQQEILLSARGHENSLSGGSQTLPCHYSSMKMKEKKRNKPHFPWLDVLHTRGWRKRWQHFSRQLLWLFLSPTNSSSPAAATSNFQHRIASVHKGEHTPCSHKWGAVLSQGHTFTSNAYLFRWNPSLKRKHEKEIPEPEHLVSHCEPSQIIEPEDVMEVKLLAKPHFPDR